MFKKCKRTTRWWNAPKPRLRAVFERLGRAPAWAEKTRGWFDFFKTHRHTTQCSTRRLNLKPQSSGRFPVCWSQRLRSLVSTRIFEFFFFLHWKVLYVRFSTTRRCTSAPASHSPTWRECQLHLPHVFPARWEWLSEGNNPKVHKLDKDDYVSAITFENIDIYSTVSI